MSSIKVAIKDLEQGEFLKLRCMISFSGAYDASAEVLTSKDFLVNNLATVRLHFKDQRKEPGLICSILAQPICGKVKVRVSCQEVEEPFYSEWICSNEWKVIGNRRYCDVSLAEVFTTLLDINISASNIEDSQLVKLYNDDDFTDFNLSAGGRTVPVHRALLAVHSDVFRAMLTREWKEKAEGSIQMEGVTSQTLQHFKDYMYLRTVPDEGLKPLLLFASYYLMDDLMAECISKLALNCKSKDWRGLLEFATKNQIFELASAIMIVNPTINIKEEQKKPLKEQETKNKKPTLVMFFK